MRQACHSRTRQCIGALFISIAGYAATGFSGAAWSLTGTVIDARTHALIAGAIVVATNATALSDASGRFALSSSTGQVSARAVGYRRAHADAGDKDSITLELEPFRPKAVYLSAYGINSKPLRDATLALTRDTVINALVIDVKDDRGLPPYRGGAREAAGAVPGKSSHLPERQMFVARLAELHGNGLYLIARIVVFKDDPLAEVHPEWAVRDASGKPWRDREELQWVDPFSQGVWRHNLDIAEEAARLGFDEVQFDYVRFPDASGLRFAQRNTRDNRTAAIVGFLSAARERLAPYNVFVSADTFGYVCWNPDDTSIGQDIGTLGTALDYISPMLYPSGFTWELPGCMNPVADPAQIVRRSLAQARQRTGLPGVRFRPWLQAFRDYAFDHREFGAQAIREQVQAAEGADTDGWMRWNPRNRYDPAELPH
ncbi:GTP-binding protein (plasmid) [Caballeronia sp. NK8]|uniref:putative glycoside hydrolase n=1 Tax=Caballeronia sp. NK8 TaxID=140098 RepID=UPI001BB523A8|nr:putative glycoside hydrolase [Caballeronia sp. NK8]BCQ28965.1 GTP-binding protein [Caballeronia sp. NK8]